MKSTILGPDGQPLDLGRLAEPQTERADRGGPNVGWLRREFDAHPARGLTPARLNAILQAAEQGDLIRQLELADDMEERDTQIYSELSKRKTAVAMLEWDIVPPEGASAAEKKWADQAREWMRAIPEFEESVILEMMDAVLKGFKPIEMWWELDQGTRQPRFAARPQRWLTLNENRDRFTLRDEASAYGVELQRYNWLLHIHRARSGYLSRMALCRVLAFPYLFKNYAHRDLAEFLEIYGLPLRLGSYPAGASDDEKRKLLQAVVQIGHNAAGIIPQGMKVEFQNAAQGTHQPFQVMMDAMDAAQSKAILGQTLTSGEGQHGTQALGNVHNEVRLDILKSDATRVAASLTAQVVHPLVMFNIPGADPRRLPRLQIDVPEPEDLNLYAEALPKLAGAGMRIGVESLHRRLRIPMARDGEEILRGPAAAPGAETVPPAPAPKPAKTAALAGQLPASGEPRDALDDLVDDAVGAWRPALAPMVEPLLAELQKGVEQGETLGAFAARLPQLIERMDGRPLGETLARAAFAANLAGQADLDITGEA
ncbi:UNVERIFIED_ORG: DUF935 domain-containing protein [Shinella sp. XGS7]|nr:DUF935 domain-containing protein [Shinella sp. XGS7]